MSDEFDDNHHHQVQCHEICSVGDRDGPTCQEEAVTGIIKGFDEKPEDTAANETPTERPAFKDWMNCHGAARSTILLDMEPMIQVQYTVFDYVNPERGKLASPTKPTLKLDISEILEELWSIK